MHNYITKQQNLEQVIQNLMVQIEDLSPHPDHPDYKGPVFVSMDGRFKPPAEYDGMFGSLIFDGLLSGIFSSASGASGLRIDWSNTAEVLSQIIEERAGVAENKKQMSLHFNTRARRKALMRAFQRDLPLRMALEHQLACAIRQLDSLSNDVSIVLPSPALAA